MTMVANSMDLPFESWLDDEPSDLSGSLATEIDAERRARAGAPRRRAVVVPSSHVALVTESAPESPVALVVRPKRSIFPVALAVAMSAGTLASFGLALAAVVTVTALLLM